MHIQTIVGIFLLLLGTCALILCVREIMFAYTSARWTQVEGILSDVELQPDEVGEGRYHVSVVYSYRLGNQDFSGSRLRFGPVESFAEKSAAPVQLHQFRVGHPCTVYVDPAKPTRAVLLPGLSGWSFLASAIACLPIFLGVEILLGKAY